VKIVLFALAIGGFLPEVHRVASPGGGLVASVEEPGNGEGVTIRVAQDGQPIAYAGVSLRLAGRPILSRQAFGKPSASTVDTTYSIPVGKRSVARDQHTALTLPLGERDEAWFLDLRVFDDAVAFRYRVPKASGGDTVLSDELTRFRFAEDCQTWTLPLASYTSSYESRYEVGPLGAVRPDTLIGLPVLLHDERAKAWIALTEADLRDFPGLYVERQAAHGGTLRARLSPLPGHPTKAKAIANGELHSPWRVILVADSPARLLESDVVFHLNPPCAIADTSWIKPGQTTFPWWNGYALGDVPFAADINTATTKHYIDFCARNGIPYHTLDGLDEAWYGGPIDPKGPTDVTRARPELDLPEVLRYARERGVRLRLWVHWRALRQQLDEALATYERWGVEGVMVDFMDRDDQEMVAFYHELGEKAARHKLTVTLHGSYKPTGMERTWPNVLSYEAAFNQEYNKWDPIGTPPRHNVQIASIRMLAGPLDFHQGGMRCVAPADYKPRDKGPPVQGTLGHQLATYIVLQNHLPMLCDVPAAYEAFPAAEFLFRIPATWDETRVPVCDVGERVVVARRSGTTWYVGAMAGTDACKLKVPLDFLDEGELVAIGWRDGADGLEPIELPLDLESSLELDLPAGGGAVYRIEPAGGE
jgi:alpha-glucosidase